MASLPSFYSLWMIGRRCRICKADTKWQIPVIPDPITVLSYHSPIRFARKGCIKILSFSKNNVLPISAGSTLFSIISVFNDICLSELSGKLLVIFIGDGSPSSVIIDPDLHTKRGIENDQ